MAWPWVGPQLAGMAAGAYKKLNTNTIELVALARTRANFGDWSGGWADDAACATVVQTGNNADMTPFSGPAIDPVAGRVKSRGGGHTDGGDGSIYSWEPATLAWTCSHKSGQYQNTAPTISCNITAITPGTPPRLTVDADIALTGDQGVVTGTINANGTYQLVRVDATHVDLYNTDGTYGAGYTAFAGGALTNSAGTLTITWNPQGASSNYYFTTSVDGFQMPPCMHTYHWKWIGGNRWLLSGNFCKDAVAQSQGRVWILDEDAAVEVYRSYHDTSTGATDVQTDTGGPWSNGPYAYDQTLGRVYGFNTALKNFNYHTFSWEAGQGADSDFQRVRSIATLGTTGGRQGYDACTLAQPGAPSNRALFAIYSSNNSWANATQFNFCADLGGTPQQSINTFSDGALFSTDMDDVGSVGVCYDDLHDEIIYWGGGATLGVITLSSTLSAWTSAELTPVSPTGDLPVRANFPSNACCAICKVPGYDAYLLARGSDIYLYARSAVGQALEGNAAGTASASGALTTQIPLAGAALSIVTANATISTSIPFAGAAAAITTADAVITTAIPLEGAAPSEASAAAGLDTGISMAASAQGAAQGQGDLTVEIRLSGAALSQAAAAAGLDAAILLAGAAQGEAGAAAELASGDIAGNAQGQAGAQGELTIQVRLQGAALSAALAAAGLDTAIPLAGGAQGAAAAGASLTTAIPFLGAAVSVSGAQADLYTNLTLAGAAQGEAASGALLDTSIPLAGTGVSITGAVGSLDTSITLAGSAIGRALGGGDLTIQIRFEGSALGAAAAAGLLSGETYRKPPARRLALVWPESRRMAVGAVA